MSLPQGAADEALALLRTLLSLDTQNPPGNERPAAEACAEVLRKAGLEPVLLEAKKDRTNLVCRLAGSGERPPLMLTAHLDVVPAGEGWTHPPFAAEEHDGFLWGRGAIDMKHHAAMCVTVMRLLAQSEQKLSRDIVLVLTADEEGGCDLGSRWLVSEHGGLIKAEYALGEIGGFTLHLGGKRLYPIQVAQKGALWMRAVARGPSGHGSMPRHDTALVKLGRAMARIGSTRLPHHPPAATRAFVEEASKVQGPVLRRALRALLSPRLGAMVLRALPDKTLARSLHAVLANTATPTIVRGGHKVNVIPDHAEFEIDGRILPGSDASVLLRELRTLVGDDVELEVVREVAPVESPQGTPLYAALAGAIRRADPEAVPVPYLVPGFTDAVAFATNGTTYYGFAPVALPPDPALKFAELYHARDERIPVEGFRWGLSVLFDAVESFCRQPLPHELLDTGT